MLGGWFDIRGRGLAVLQAIEHDPTWPEASSAFLQVSYPSGDSPQDKS